MLLFLLSLCGPSLVPKILDLCFPNLYTPVFNVRIDPQDQFKKKNWKSTKYYFYYLQSGLCAPSENLISKSVFQLQKTTFQWTFIQNLEISSEYEAGKRSSGRGLPSYCYCIECGVVYSVRGRYSKDTTARDMMWSQRTASYSGCTDSPDRDYATVPWRLYYCITALMDATLVGWWLDHLTA